MWFLSSPEAQSMAYPLDLNSLPSHRHRHWEAFLQVVLTSVESGHLQGLCSLALSQIYCCHPSLCSPLRQMAVTKIQAIDVLQNLCPLGLLDLGSGQNLQQGFHFHNELFFFLRG